jgi:hypothetical protein
MRTPVQAVDVRITAATVGMKQVETHLARHATCEPRERCRNHLSRHTPHGHTMKCDLTTRRSPLPREHVDLVPSAACETLGDLARKELESTRRAELLRDDRNAWAPARSHRTTSTRSGSDSVCGR